MKTQRLSILLLIIALASIIAIPLRQANATQATSIPATPNPAPPPTTATPSSPPPKYYGSSGPKLGPQRWVVLMVEFADVRHTRTKDNVTRIVQAATNYWRETSYGKMWIEFQIFGWYQVPNAMAYYGKDLGERDARGDQLIEQAVKRADPDVDFSKFEYLIIVHAGHDQADTPNPDLIWSSCYCGIFPSYYNPLSIKTSSGVIIRQAALVSEFDDYGTLAHESGHLLGLPDLYNIASGGRDNFVGPWSLMADETNAEGLEAWSRILLGWLTPSTLSVQAKPAWYLLKPLALAEGLRALKFTIDEKHYFLIELRLRMSTDIGIPAEGVLVTYIDETRRSGRGIVQVQAKDNSTRTLNEAAYGFKDNFSIPSLSFHFQVLASTNIGYAVLFSSQRSALDNVEPITITATPLQPARFLDSVSLEVSVRDTKTSTALAGLQVLAEYNAPGLGWITIGVAKTDDNGKATFNLRIITRPGNYEVRYSSPGGELGGRFLYGMAITKNLEVKKGVLEPAVDMPGTIGAYEQLRIKLRLRDAQGNAIQNVTVRIFVDDSPDEMKFEADGYTWRTTFDLTKLGEHAVRIQVLGAALFENLSFTKTLSVQALSIPVTVGVLLIVGLSIATWRFGLPILRGQRKVPVRLIRILHLDQLNRRAVCPTCGSHALLGSKFCEICGTSLPLQAPEVIGKALMFCSECGSRIPKTSKFCEVCGSRPVPLAD